MAFSTFANRCTCVMQLAVCQPAHLARLTLPEQSHLVLAGSQSVTIDAVVREIQFAADEPLRMLLLRRPAPWSMAQTIPAPAPPRPRTPPAAPRCADTSPRTAQDSSPEPSPQIPTGERNTRFSRQARIQIRTFFRPFHAQPSVIHPAMVEGTLYNSAPATTATFR